MIKRRAIPKEIRQAVYEKCGKRCAYCGVGDTPDVWRLAELPSEWKPFEKEEIHG